MQILDFEQGSPEWLEARKGIPNASSFGRIITPAKAQKAKTAQRSYMAELIAESLVDIDAWKGNRTTDRGHEMEPAARAWYEFENDCDVQQVGMVLADGGVASCSPDGLVGDDGGLEIKSHEPKIHMQILISQTMPAEHKPQVHGNLLITHRQWWDYVSWCPGLDPFVTRIYPDEFTQKLRGVLGEFVRDLLKEKQKWVKVA